MHLEPELVFLFFLPPILYSAGYFTSIRDFRANLRPILLLSIGLVLFTTVIAAAVLKAFVPDLPWAAAFAFGAIVSPPDAVAATTVFKRLHVPRRLVTILEGESLVNDATALVLAADVARGAGRDVQRRRREHRLRGRGGRRHPHRPRSWDGSPAGS